MPYLVIEDFSAGIDLRKSAVTAPPGTLRVLRDGWINAGGEIEKRKAFVAEYELPAGTFGLAPFNSQPYVFGSEDELLGLPSGVGYQKLPGLSYIKRFRDSAVFQGKLYVTLERDLPFPNVDYYFYDGTFVFTTYRKLFPVRVFRSKVFSTSDKFVVFTAVNDATQIGTGTGGGAIELDTQGDGDWHATGLEIYYDQLALFGRTAIQLWNMDEDPARNALVQTLGNIGAAAPHAIVRYGSGDVLFLSDSGIRSLRARDSSNSAIVSDIGSPLDEIVRPIVQAMNDGHLATARACVDPLTGNVWFVFPPVGVNAARAFVLSSIPGTRVSAWGEFTTPSAADMIPRVVGGRVMVRTGDTIYVYGGMTGDVYDATECEVILPMLSAGTPATPKLWKGLDAAVEGTWTVDIGTDPAQPDLFERVATITGPTFGLQQLGLHNRGTHITARLRSVGTGRARIGTLVFHYDAEPAA